MSIKRFTPRETGDPDTLAVAGRVRVIRPLTGDEADLDETGPMYRVRSMATGREADAFADELTDEGDN